MTEAHTLDTLRAEAQTTPARQTRDALHALSESHAALSHHDRWAAGAEDTLRAAIGTERKAGMEMRIGLGADADALPIRKTAPLGGMTLPELLAEYRQNRVHTLALLDLLIATSGHREVLAWTLGEEVPPDVYALSLRNRLTRLGEGVAEQRLDA